MNKKISRIIATVMLVLAVAFVTYAINYPEGFLPWSNDITSVLYDIYLAIMIVLFINFSTKNTPTSKRSVGGTMNL